MYRRTDQKVPFPCFSRPFAGNHSCAEFPRTWSPFESAHSSVTEPSAQGNTLRPVESIPGDFTSVPRQSRLFHFAKLLAKSLGEIDWSGISREIETPRRKAGGDRGEKRTSEKGERIHWGREGEERERSKNRGRVTCLFFTIEAHCS